MNDKNREQKIEKAQLKILFDLKFFGAGMMKLENVFIDETEAMALFRTTNPAALTACTDGKNIKWFRGFLDSLKPAEVPTVLVHEVWHCLAGHLWRAPDGVDWELWNIAADHETNNMINEFALRIRSRDGTNPLPFPEPANRFCSDPRYAGWAVEAIYADLEKQGLKKPTGLVKAVLAGSQIGNSGLIEPGSMPNFGQMIRPEPGMSKQLSNSWTATLLQSAKMTRGIVPGNLSKMVEGIVSPKLHWTEILRSHLREASNDDWDFDVPAVEYEPSGFLLPSLRGERMGTVVFGSDWSGSTYGELVEQFHAEKQNCLDNMCPSRLIDIGFDTRVVAEHEYYPGDKITKEIKGGGGTSFVEVLRHCEAMNPEPKVVVILTDLEGTFPKKAPPFPVIWVVYGNKNAKAPFGETIHAN